MLKILATLNLLIVGGGLGYLINQNRRLIKKMNEKEIQLDEALGNLKQNIGTIGTGINSLIESNAQAAQALADLKAANPDLSDELATVQSFVEQTATMASNIEKAIAPVVAAGGGESGGDTSGGAGASGGGSTSGEATGATGAGSTGEPGAGSGEVVTGDNVDSSVSVNSDTAESNPGNTEEFPQV